MSNKTIPHVWRTLSVICAVVYFSPTGLSLWGSCRALFAWPVSQPPCAAVAPKLALADSGPRPLGTANCRAVEGSAQEMRGWIWSRLLLTAGKAAGFHRLKKDGAL